MSSRVTEVEIYQVADVRPAEVEATFLSNAIAVYISILLLSNNHNSIFSIVFFFSSSTFLSMRGRQPSVMRL